ncbi:hypothetical protein [Acetobacter malorum]|uniref:hypothetical protein n=1 Tax=Acetobacter malorum TaxID=178901 RepID=UPI0012E848B8|nr:hypothetical protein [Acetobacter malorum]
MAARLDQGRYNELSGSQAAHTALDPMDWARRRSAAQAVSVEVVSPALPVVPTQGRQKRP